MHIVVNRLTFKADADWEAMKAKIPAFAEVVRAEPDFIGIELLRVDQTTGIIMVRYKNRDTLDKASSEIAAPWFAQNMRQFLGGPADRVVGEVVASGGPGV